MTGLEVRRLPEAHYRTAPRLEVSHTFDWTPGPLWLYAAPGSGVWWDPGRRAIARNMVDAAVRWHGVAKVAAALRAQAPTNPDYPHWHAAFIGLSWEAVVLGAAALTLTLTLALTPALTPALTLALTPALTLAIAIAIALQSPSLQPGAAARGGSLLEHTHRGRGGAHLGRRLLRSLLPSRAAGRQAQPHNPEL